MGKILKPIKEYVAALKQALKEKIEKMNTIPALAIIQVGNVEASNRYVKNKVKDCEEVGIKAHVYWYADSITEVELIDEVLDLQEHYHGIIVQLPLPQHIRSDRVIAAIKPEKDVDGFHYDSWFKAATPKGIMDYLEYCNFDLEGKNVVIIGRGPTVGKPLAAMMTDANATVTLCHSKSKLSSFIYQADLIIVAVGKPGFFNCYPIHSPIIDVGINVDENGKLVGDCINKEDRDVTPVPGGVGLLTRVALLDNVAEACFMAEKAQMKCSEDGQCRIDCIWYDKGGCKNATE
jgi:methylenetetrahydrofolate dehydrogenase (NADP+)/methenyltetrahydrofolate cyclohydrolase